MSRKEAGTKDISEYTNKKAAARLQHHVLSHLFGTWWDGSQVSLYLTDHTS